MDFTLAMRNPTLNASFKLDISLDSYRINQAWIIDSMCITDPFPSISASQADFVGAGRLGLKSIRIKVGRVTREPVQLVFPNLLLFHFLKDSLFEAPCLVWDVSKEACRFPSCKFVLVTL